MPYYLFRSRYYFTRENKKFLKNFLNWAQLPFLLLFSIKFLLFCCFSFARFWVCVTSWQILSKKTKCVQHCTGTKKCKFHRHNTMLGNTLRYFFSQTFFEQSVFTCIFQLFWNSKKEKYLFCRHLINFKFASSHFPDTVHCKF